MKRSSLRVRESLARLLWQDNRSRSPARFRPRLECLEQRRLLAVAVDLASITGRVFEDLTGNGFDPGEEVAEAQLALYLDDGDGVFDPEGGDTALDTTLSDANGLYEFARLEAGDYFVLQPEQTVAGRTLQRSVSPRITIDAAAAQGRIVMSIDSFDMTSQSVRDDTNDGVPVTSSVAAPEAIGGERDLFVSKTSDNGAVQLSANDPLLPDLLSFDSLQFGDGIRRVIWDGPDGDATTIDDAGLAATDLTSSDEAAGVRLQIGADLEGGTAIVRIYSDDGTAGTATRFSETTIPIPATGGLPSSAEFVPFSDFTATGGGADFSQVGAIELEIAGQRNVNGTVELVGAAGPTVFTNDFPNFASADLSLSKSVDDDRPAVGQNVTFNITVANSGPDAATGVAVSDLLPSGLALVSASASQGTYDATTGRWEVGTLNDAATATLTLVATVTDAGAKTNTAEIVAADQFDPDSTPGNKDPAEDDQDAVIVTPTSIDLSLTKTISDPRPNVGSDVTFVITVQNTGPDTATGVVVTDSLPDNVTLLSDDASQGSFDAATGEWTLGTLTPDSSATLALTARVISIGTGTNTAEITAASPGDIDSTPGNNVEAEDDQDSVSFTTPVADLSLTKTVSDPSPSVGDTVTFDVTLANEGPDEATDIVVTDTLSEGLRFVSATPSVGSFDSESGAWSIDILADAATATLTMVAVVESLGTETNSAEVTAVTQADPDSTPGNNDPAEDDQDAVIVTPTSIDLSLTKTISDPRPNVGSDVTFVVTVQNTGPDTATGVVVTDSLPDNVTLLSDDASQGSFDAATGEWTLGTLTPDSSATLALTARVTSIGTGTNTAEITAASPGDIDSTPGNNVEAEDDQDSVSFTTPVADLSLTKTVSDPSPSVGDTVTFDVTLANEGPDGATDIVVTDTLSEGLRFVSATPSVGSFDSESGAWSIDVLADAATATLTMVAVVESLGTETNSAEVTAVTQADPDSTPGNNDPAEDDQTSVAVTVPTADLSLTKSVDDATPGVGSEVTFTLVVANAGPEAAGDIVVGDSLPDGLTLVSADPSVGSYDADSGTWTIPTLAADASAQLLLRATADTPGDKTNTAEILSSNQPDPDSTPGNNDPTEDDFASVTLSPELVDLALTKALDDLSPNVGDSIAYTLSLTNEGPSTASGVAVTDPLPVGVAFENATASQGTYDPATGIWSVGEIAPGVVPTLRIEVTVGNTSGATNTAEVTAADQPDVDSTPGNGDPEEDDIATATFATRVADLSLTKVVDNPTPNRDETVTFALTLSNAGPDDASGITVSDRLPEGLTFVSATPSTGTYDATEGLWTVADLGTDSEATLTITASATSPGPAVNTAEVTAARQFDPDSTPGNADPDEDDFATVTVTPPLVDVAVAAAVDNAAPQEGDVVQITFTTSNTGPSTATGLVFRTDLPEGLTLLGAQPSRGTFDAASGRWAVDELGPDDQAELVLTVRVDTAGPREIPFELIALDQFDIDSTPGNNIEEEDDQTSAVLQGPRVLSKRLFLAR